MSDLEKEEVKKENTGNWKNVLKIILVLVVGFIAGWLSFSEVKKLDKDNNKEGVKEEDNKSEDKDEAINEKEEVISTELKKDLEKKAEISKFLAVDIIFDDEIWNEGLKNVIAENEERYEYLSVVTYEYYLYKTGKVAEKWTSKDESYKPCYEAGQNGYCYVVDKDEMLSYDKQLYNIGSELVKVDTSFFMAKDDKFYITDIPFNGWITVETIGEVSITKNDDKSINYIVNYNVSGIGTQEVRSVNINYTFKLNADGDYYLYSVTKV